MSKNAFKIYVPIDSKHMKKIPSYFLSKKCKSKPQWHTIYTHMDCPQGDNSVRKDTETRKLWYIIEGNVK